MAITNSEACRGVPPDQVRSLLSESGHAVELSARIASLERTSSRIEAILERISTRVAGEDDDSLAEEERKACEVDNTL